MAQIHPGRGPLGALVPVPAADRTDPRRSCIEKALPAGDGGGRDARRGERRGPGAGYCGTHAGPRRALPVRCQGFDAGGSGGRQAPGARLALWLREPRGRASEPAGAVSRHGLRLPQKFQTMKLPKDRVPYSAIVDRPPRKLPGDARIAVWTIVNVEEWSIERNMPRTVLPPPYGQPLQPDLPNWAWHEYGMRVGFWRFVDVLARFKLRATLAINGSVIDSYRRVAEAGRDAGWEFMGHGWIQRPMHHVEDQRKAIADTVAAIREFTGKPPRGWESPGLTETYDTIDWLAEAGIEYVADWVLDDQPVTINTAHGPIVSVPYTVEMNDIAMMALQQHPSEEWLRRGVDQFDRLHQEGEKSARIMAISVHPYITGVPHRIGYLERLYDYIRQRPGVWLTTGEEILDWYRSAR